MGHILKVEYFKVRYETKYNIFLKIKFKDTKISYKSNIFNKKASVSEGFFFLCLELVS